MEGLLCLLSYVGMRLCGGEGDEFVLEQFVVRRHLEHFSDIVCSVMSFYLSERCYFLFRGEEGRG